MNRRHQATLILVNPLLMPDFSALLEWMFAQRHSPSRALAASNKAAA
jgi:hypothetical protein